MTGRCMDAVTGVGLLDSAILVRGCARGDEWAQVEIEEEDDDDSY